MAKKKGGSLFVWIAVGVLTFGMVGFGASGLSGRVSSIGTVGDLPIPVTNYANELQGQIAAASAQFGTRLSFAQANDLRIPLRAQQQVIADRVLDNELRQLGISVGDDTVRQEVFGNLAFAGPDGTFSRDEYRAILRDNGLTEAEYEASIRDDTARALLQVAVISGLPDPTTYAETLATFIGEQRSFTWGSLTEADLEGENAAPTDADLTAHYAANPDSYTTAETKALTFAWLTPDMIQDAVTVDEAELREAYQDRIDEFVQPERRLVERLVYSSTEAAEAALAAITAGDTDFDQLVADRGLDLTDVDMGDVTEGELGDAGAAVFAAEPGMVVGPFESPLGPSLFRMNAILAAQETPFEEAIPLLREDRAAARARRIIEDQIDPLTDLLAGGARLEDLVEQSDMTLDQMDWTETSDDGIAAYAAFREAVEGLQPGAFPELLELEDGGLFAVRVDEIREPALLPLETVRDRVAADWNAAETRRRLMALAEETAAGITAETEFTQVGLTDAIAETGLTRRDFLGGTPPGFMDRIFAMTQGEVIVVEDADKVIVARLDAVAPPDEGDETVAAETAAAAASAGEGMARDIFAYFSQAVRSRTEITIDDAAINAVHANFR